MAKKIFFFKRAVNLFQFSHSIDLYILNIAIVVVFDNKREKKMVVVDIYLYKYLIIVVSELYFIMYKRV